MKALVTGAGVRLGRAVALALADAGFDVAVHHHSSAGPAAEVAELVRQRGRRALLLKADLADAEDCGRLCRALSDAWGGVDVLVNNAALYTSVDADRITVAQWDRMQAVNTRAPFLLTQGLLDGLRASAHPGGGVVINLCDIGGERPTPGYAHYSVSKAGLIMLTRALALELAPRVRVNGVSPGTVLPPEDQAPDTRDAIRATIPAGRFGSPDDVAAAVVFLVCRAPYITGQILAVDGGRSVGGPMTAG